MEKSIIDELASIKADAKIVAEQKANAEKYREDYGTTENEDSPALYFIRADAGNADRLIDAHGRDIRYCFAANNWYVWSGLHWEPDAHASILRLAKGVMRDLLDRSAANIESDRNAEGDAKWALRSLYRSRLDSMLYLAQPEKPIDIADFDADPFILGAENGYVNLRSGTLLEPERAGYVTKLVSTKYDADAQAPRWLQFLEEIFEGKSDLIDFIHRAVGYSLTGDTSEQCFFLLYGRGRNGKSTFVETLLQALGPYGLQTQPEAIMQSRRDGGAASPHIAQMAGVRYLTSVETAEGKRLNESLVKQLTGGDTISARYLNQNPFTFTPQFKLWLATNYPPEIGDTSVAMWRRIRLIPFNARFEGDTDDKSLKKTLITELPGILAWAVRGAIEWQARGLEPPTEVLRATGDYQQSQDMLGDFIEDIVVSAQGIHTPKQMLYRAYENWCRENGESPITQRKLSQELQLREWHEIRLGKTRIRSWENVNVRGDGND